MHERSKHRKHAAMVRARLRAVCEEGDGAFGKAAYDNWERRA
jgi:hypothetical protein